MKNIRLFTKWLCSVMTLLLAVLPIERGTAQDVQEKHEIDGQVLIKIESKSLTLQEAQSHIQKKDSIPLVVSLILKGEWVDVISKGFHAFINQSSFSYGIAQSAGDNVQTPAPLYESNPPAWMLAARSMNCADGGTSLRVPMFQQGMYANTLGWETQGCPTFAYGLGYSEGTTFNNGLTLQTDGSESYYEIKLFSIYFKLKRLETVYVRGIDGNYGTDPDGSLSTTAMTTELNIVNFDSRTYCYWPGCPNPSSAADWTEAPKDYYGGVIPGGIFIEQVPELTQFEP